MVIAMGGRTQYQWLCVGCSKDRGRENVKSTRGTVMLHTQKYVIDGEVWESVHLSPSRPRTCIDCEEKYSGTSMLRTPVDDEIELKEYENTLDEIEDEDLNAGDNSG